MTLSPILWTQLSPLFVQFSLCMLEIAYTALEPKVQTFQDLRIHLDQAGSATKQALQLSSAQFISVVPCNHLPALSIFPRKRLSEDCFSHLLSVLDYYLPGGSILPSISCPLSWHVHGTYIHNLLKVSVALRNFFLDNGPIFCKLWASSASIVDESLPPGVFASCEVSNNWIQLITDSLSLVK